MNKRLFLVAVRLALGITTLIAVVVQILVVRNQNVFDPLNYFGYFTNLSNIVAAIVFIIGAVYLARSRKPTPKGDVLRGAATLYMTITGIVYITLLSGEDLGLLLPWVNILMHIIMPLAVVADWLYQPPLSKISLRQAAWWLAFPAVYLIYTLIRGAIVNWYPYPFLNPAKAGGYGGVAIYGAVILVGFCLCGWAILALGNKRTRHV